MGKPYQSPVASAPELPSATLAGLPVIGRGPGKGTRTHLRCGRLARSMPSRLDHRNGFIVTFGVCTLCRLLSPRFFSIGNGCVQLPVPTETPETLARHSTTELLGALTRLKRTVSPILTNAAVIPCSAVVDPQGVNDPPHRVTPEIIQPVDHHNEGPSLEKTFTSSRSTKEHEPSHSPPGCQAHSNGDS